MKTIVILVILLSFVPRVLYSQIELGMLKYPIFVTVEKGGNLEKEIERNGYDKENIKTLKILGEINAKDIQCINEMTNIKFLDLSEVNIQAGNKSYTYIELNEKGKKIKNKNKIKESNSLSRGMFYGLKQILAIKLPKNTRVIEKDVFPRKQYFDIYFTGQPPMLISSQCIERCQTIIVPNSYYDNYISLNTYKTYQDKILKDSVPETFNLNLSDNDIEYYLKGAYPYVKNITIVGKLSKKDIDCLKKCVNLESINLLDATIQDMDELEQWGTLVANNVSKSDTLKKIETEYLKMLDEISLLESEKEKIIKKRDTAEEKEFVYGLLSAVVELSNEQIEKEYKNDNVSTDYYIQNRVFNNMLGSELHKELKNLSSFRNPEKVNQVIAIIDYKIIELNEEKDRIEEEMNYLTEQYHREMSEMSQKVYNNSIIPNDFFKCFAKIKNIVLPYNTIIIPERSLPLKGVKVQMNKKNILIGRNIYY